MNYPIGMFGTQLEQLIPLKGVQVDARIRDLFCDVTVKQIYENTEGQPIEAVYTFPLPLDAVLLNVEVTLGEKKLHGHVVARQEAEERYEEAIVAGDAAIRLQRVEPGLYAMNLGNLLAGEPAVIKFRYGQLLRWNGDHVRFHLPTTIAPRYGVPQMAPHLVPPVSLSVDHAFRLKITIDGLLARADISCPTHRVRFAFPDASLHVELAEGEALMDRDFVLNLALTTGARSAAVSVADRDASVALLSWRPSFPETQGSAPRAVKIVVDCSGSMNGDSIAQARVALKRILESLRPQDHFDIVRFGSQPQVLFGTLQPASGRHLARAMEMAQSMQADLGGTEIGSALDAAYRIHRPADAPHSDVLLITDGEVNNTEPLVGAAKSSGHRIFTVGVGASVAEALVRRLADETGGACELVHPNEQMAERIVRHFQRIFLTRISSVDIAWPCLPVRQVPATLKGIFDGDTIHAFAWLRSPTGGEIAIDATLENGTVVREMVPVEALPSTGDHATSPGHPVARLAAAAWITESPEEASSVALQYQLLSDATDFLVVHARAGDAKAQGLPVLRTVPHMLAAGRGGVGSVGLSLGLSDFVGEVAMFGVDASAPAPAYLHESRRLQMDSAGPVENDDWVVTLGELLYLNANTQRLTLSGIALLQSAGAPFVLIEALLQIVSDGADEDTVVLAFLQELAQSELAQGLSRQARRVVAKISNDRPADRALAERIKQALSIILPAPKSVFDAFADTEQYAFDKTVVPVRLAQHEGEKLVSRSQAKQVAHRFERFKEVVLDFDGVAEIGQAFADELFRVFATAHPDVRLRPINTSQAVAQMVQRAMSASGTAK